MTGKDILFALSEIDDDLIAGALDAAEDMDAEGASASEDADRDKVIPVGGGSAAGIKGIRRVTSALIAVAAAAVILFAVVPLARRASLKEKPVENTKAAAATAADAAAGDEAYVSGEAVKAAEVEEAAQMADAYEAEAPAAGAYETDEYDADAYEAAAYEEAAPADEEAVTLAGTVDRRESIVVGGNQTAVPNPFITYDSLDKAEKAVGFGLPVPEEFEGLKLSEIRGMGKEMLEVIYRDDSGEEHFRIRKSPEADQDISGDYNTYSKIGEVRTDDSVVEIRGDRDDEVSVAVWSCDGCSYAIDAQDHPLTKEMLLDFKSLMAEQA